MFSHYIRARRARAHCSGSYAIRRTVLNVKSVSRVMTLYCVTCSKTKWYSADGGRQMFHVGVSISSSSV